MKRMCIIFVLTSCVLCQETGNNQTSPDSKKRVPLIPPPGKCPENQILYPSNKDDWICDCAPGTLYYPPKDGCFAAYRQGPCKEGNILVLKKSDVSSTCIPNPCKVDGQVSYNNQCYELNKSGPPCKSVNEGGGIFGVNATTHELGCLMGLDPYSLLDAPANCQKGTRRDSFNMCQEVFGGK